MRKPWLAAGILLLALAVVLLWKKSTAPATQVSPTASSVSSKSTNHTAPTRTTDTKSGFTRVAAKDPGLQPSPNFPDPGMHEVEDLPRFILPPLELEDATLAEALTALLQSYQEVCLRTNQTPLPFSYRLNVASQERREVKLDSQDIRRSLYQLAITFNALLDWDDNRLTYLAENEQRPNGPALEFTAQVPRTIDFLDTFDRLLSDGESLHFDPESFLLEGQIRQETRLRIETLLESAAEPASQQNRLLAKVVSSSNEIEFPTDYINQSQVDGFLRQLAQVQGTDIMTMPSVVSYFGENATIEVVKEVVPEAGSTPPYPTNDDGTYWTGVQFQGSINGYGFGVQQDFDFEVRPGTGSTDPFGHLVMEQADIAPDNRTFVHHSISEDGQHRYVFITTNLIDPTGAAINP